MHLPSVLFGIFMGLLLIGLIWGLKKAVLERRRADIKPVTLQREEVLEGEDPQVTIMRGVF